MDEERILFKKKNEVAEEIWNRVKMILEERKISQVQLQKLCNSNGYKVTQPEISKLYSGTIQMTLYHLIAFSEVLDVPVAQFTEKVQPPEFGFVSGGAFITDPENEAFRGYLGPYYTVFHSTNALEDKFLTGKLKLIPMKKEKICKAVFWLNTGRTNRQGEVIWKRYEGQFMLSGRTDVAYCILMNKNIGELNVLEFRHRNFLTQELQCRLGLVLTTSTGEIKAPVVHRMLISRGEITEDVLKKITPFLKVGMEETILRKQDLKILLEKQASEIEFDFEALMDTAEEYISVDEFGIRGINRRMSKRDISSILSMLKQSSREPFLSGISEGEDSQLYEVLQNLQND